MCAQINQVPYRRFEGMSDDFLQHYQQVVSTLNSLAGYNGQIELKNHLSLNGNRVINVGTAANSGDVVTQEYAQSKYSATALRPQLEASGSTPLQTPRQLNNQVQRESYSSYLNDILSTPPNANNIQVLFSVPGAGMTTITIPASVFHFADGTAMQINAFSLTVNDSNVYTIQAAPTGAVCVSEVATITATTAITGVTIGSYIQVAGVTDTDFNGKWTVTGVGSNYVTYDFPFADTTSGGGTLQTSGIYYFYITKGNPNPQYVGAAFSADSPYNRLITSMDGRQLIAVATVGSGGGVANLSAGGGTPGSQLNAGSFF